MNGEKIGRFSIKLADAALVARGRGDDVHALFFAVKAAECLQLAKCLGWHPEVALSAGQSGTPPIKEQDAEAALSALPVVSIEKGFRRRTGQADRDK